MSAIDESGAQVVLYEAALREQWAAERKGHWAVIKGLTPYRDGDTWFVLDGANVQVGITGMGSTPEFAVLAFDHAMRCPSGCAEWTPRGPVEVGKKP